MRDALRLAAVLLGGLVLSSTGRADDKVVGAIWKIEYKANGKAITIQCVGEKEGKVFEHKGKEIGTWKQNGAVAEITISGADKGNGKYEITQLKKDPPSYRGKCTTEKGKETDITVTLVED